MNTKANTVSSRLLKGVLCAFGLSAMLASSVSAATLAYWEFEPASWLGDSSGNGYTLTQNGSTVGTYSLPESTGAGSAFPKLIYGQANTQAIQGTWTTSLNFAGTTLNAPSSVTTALNATSSFTLEAFINMNSTSSTAETLISLGGSGTTNGSWVLGVTSTTSGLGNSVLFFQYARSDGSWGSNSLTNMNSGYQIEAGKDYYIAISVSKTDSSENGIIFYIKNLTDDTDMVTITLSRTEAQATMYDETTLELTIGGTWSGTIDNVRISDTQLEVSDLLISNIPEASSAGWLGLLVVSLAGWRIYRRRK